MERFQTLNVPRSLPFNLYTNLSSSIEAV